MKHFILSALIMAASLSFYTATASAQVTIVSDETDLEMTFLGHLDIWGDEMS